MKVKANKVTKSGSSIERQRQGNTTSPSSERYLVGLGGNLVAADCSELSHKRLEGLAVSFYFYFY